MRGFSRRKPPRLVINVFVKDSDSALTQCASNFSDELRRVGNEQATQRHHEKSKTAFRLTSRPSSRLGESGHSSGHWPRSGPAQFPGSVPIVRWRKLRRCARRFRQDRASRNRARNRIGSTRDPMLIPARRHAFERGRSPDAMLQTETLDLFVVRAEHIIGLNFFRHRIGYYKGCRIGASTEFGRGNYCPRKIAPPFMTTCT